MDAQDYPCSICQKSSENLSIECSICSNWIHFACVPLSKDQIAEWSATDAEFTCRSCAFQRSDGAERFDFGMFLNRLRIAVLSKDISRQQIVAKEILLIMSTYRVTLPDVVDKFNGEVDNVSMDLLRLYHPIMLQTFRPIRTHGDGNCLYRAVSRVLYGSESHHVQLRLRAAAEIILQQHLYDTESPTYKDQIQSVYVVCSGYQDLVASTVRLGAYAELLHMYALSAVSGFVLKSYYPPADPVGNLSGSFTRCVIGHNSKEFPHGTPIIMWTQAFLPTRGKSFSPNHFVPLQDITKSPAEVDIVDISDYEDEEEKARNGEPTETVDTDSGYDLPPTNEEELEKCEDVPFPLCSIEGPSMGYLTNGKFMDILDCLGHLSDSEDMLKEIPPGHKNNVFFIIDNSKNRERRSRGEPSQFWDDCGVWIRSSGGSPKAYFLIRDGMAKSVLMRNGQICTEQQHNKKRVYTPVMPQPNEEELLILQRYYCCSKESSQYRKRVTWIHQMPSTCQVKCPDLAVVEYSGQFPGRPVHGNSKMSCKYYRRTKPEVMDSIGHLSSAMGPRNVYDRLHHQTDNPTLLPMSIQQVQNKRKQVLKKSREQAGNIPSAGNFADNVLSFIQAAHDHPFIKNVCLSSTKVPTIVCYANAHLQDIKRFCAGGDKEIWGFDKTFNLGDVFVTTSVFKHKGVKDRVTNDHPLFLGPVFLHGNSDFETYNQLFSVLAGKFSDQEIAALTIGSDDETAMRKAVRRQFPSSLNIVCTRHLKTNVKDYLLSHTSACAEERREVMQTIFGANGITSAEDTDVLKYRVDAAINQWTINLQTFINYFRTRLLPILHENVCIPQQVREMSDLWTNNNTESVNHVLKVKTDWKQLKLVDLISRIYEHVDAKYKDLKRALYGEGSFYLTEAFRTHVVSSDVWFCRTEDERASAFQKFMADRGKKPTDKVTSTDGSFTVTIKPTRSKKINQIRRSRAEKTATIKRQRKA